MAVNSRQIPVAIPNTEALRDIDPLGALEPVWDEFYRAEQARILRLLIERIDS